MLDKFIRRLYYFLFFATPLVMASQTSELFEFNKIMLIYFFAVVIGFLWCIKMIVIKKIIVKRTPFDIPIVLFFVSQIVSWFLSIDRHTSFFGYYGRFNGGILSLAVSIFLYYAAVSNLTKDAVIRVLKVSLLSSFIVILWGVPGKFGYDLSCLLFTGKFNNSCWTDQFRPAERMFSTLGQPNWLGAYLAVNFFIGIYFYLKSSISNRKLQNWGVLLYLVFNFSAVLFTRSRSSLAAVVISLVIFLLILFFSNRDFFKTQLRKIVLLLVIMAISIVLFQTGIEKADRYLTISSYFVAKNSGASVGGGLLQKAEQSGVTESGDIRKIVWEGALELGMKYPLFGTGVETFAYSYYFVRPKAHNLTSEWDYLYNKAHNEYLNYFATTGFIGLISYLVLIVTVLIYSWSKLKYPFVQTQGKQISLRSNSGQAKIKMLVQNSKSQNRSEQTQITNHQLLIICLTLSYLTILITNFFGFSTTTINIYFYLISAFIVLINSTVVGNKYEEAAPLGGKQWGLSILIGIVSLLSLWYLSTYYMADLAYAKGDTFVKLNRYQEAAQSLDQAMKLRYDHVYADKLSNVLANLALVVSYQKEPEATNNLMNFSQSLNEKSLLDSPMNVLYLKTTAKNEYLFYQINVKQEHLQKGISALEKAQTFSPTDPKIPYSLAIFYSLLEDTAQIQNEKTKAMNLALKNIDISIDLKPDYRDAYFLKGQLLKKFGRNDEAQKIFSYILKTLDPNDEQVKKELQ